MSRIAKPNTRAPRPSRNVFSAIEKLARALDEAGKPTQEIRVVATRAYLRRRYKPQARNAALFHGKHRLEIQEPGGPAVRAERAAHQANRIEFDGDRDSLAGLGDV
jgi:hypothetical protein